MVVGFAVNVLVGAGSKATVFWVGMGSGVGEALQAVTAVTIPTRIKTQMRIAYCVVRKYLLLRTTQYASRFNLSNRDQIPSEAGE